MCICHARYIHVNLPSKTAGLTRQAACFLLQFCELSVEGIAHLGRRFGHTAHYFMRYVYWFGWVWELRAFVTGLYIEEDEGDAVDARRYKLNNNNNNIKDT